jgi:hypothetical protein
MKVSLWVAGALFASVCSAGTVAVDSVTASSTYFSYNVDNLINGSGLSGGLHDNDWYHMWLTSGTVTGWLIFDLGSVTSLSSTDVWNYNASCCGLDRGVQDLSISTSTNGVDYNAFGAFTLTEGTGGWIPADVIDLGGVSARYVEFFLTSNYGDSDFTGLSAVQFEGGSVPEPASGTLLLVGVASLVTYARRRR